MLFEAVLSKVIPPWATVVAIEALVGTLARVRPDVTVNLEECGADPLAVIAEESTALKIVKGLLRGVLYRYNLLGTAHAGLLGLLLLNITWPGHICIEDLQGKKESGRLKFYSKKYFDAIFIFYHSQILLESTPTFEIFKIMPLSLRNRKEIYKNLSWWSQVLRKMIFLWNMGKKISPAPPFSRNSRKQRGRATILFYPCHIQQIVFTSTSLPSITKQSISETWNNKGHN